MPAALDDLGARIRVNAEPEGFAFSHDAASLGRARMWNLTCPAGSFDVTKGSAGRPKDLATLPALKRWLRAVETVEPAERTRALAAALDKRRRPNGGADWDAAGR